MSNLSDNKIAGDRWHKWPDEKSGLGEDCNIIMNYGDFTKEWDGIYTFDGFGFKAIPPQFSDMIVAWRYADIPEPPREFEDDVDTRDFDHLDERIAALERSLEDMLAQYIPVRFAIDKLRKDVNALWAVIYGQLPGEEHAVGLLERVGMLVDAHNKSIIEQYNEPAETTEPEIKPLGVFTPEIRERIDGRWEWTFGDITDMFFLEMWGVVDSREKAIAHWHEVCARILGETP